MGVNKLTLIPALVHLQLQYTSMYIPSRPNQHSSPNQR
jgi:hypothetical protein